MFAKIIGGAAVDKKLIIGDIRATAAVKEAIEKAGGRFEAVAKKTKSVKKV